MNSEASTPNESLRRARILRGWSQAELAEQVGTSFEMVSRWERGITVPSPYYRMRLSGVLGQTPEELGLVRDLKHSFTPPSSPFMLLASANVDAEKTIVSHLKSALNVRGITVWSSRQIGKSRNGNTPTNIWEAVRAADALLVVISPQSRSSRHVRDSFEVARIYQRPVYGIWIEGEHVEQCLPEGHVELAALIDAREKDYTATLEEIVTALEPVRVASLDTPEEAQASLPDTPMITVPQMALPESMLQSEPLAGLPPLQNQIAERVSALPHTLEPTNGARPGTQALPAKLPTTSNRKGPSRMRVVLLIGLAILVIAGGLLGSFSLLTHFGAHSAQRGPSVITPVHGGTWTYGLPGDASSLIPNGTNDSASAEIDEALYLPLFYGDAQGVIHPAAAMEVPTVKNGGVNADATTWTFHLRPHLVWSDGQPYDVRDVDFTWKLWANAKFGTASSLGLDLISSTNVSADHLAITFHLKHPFAPFLADLWVDGLLAPLPEHHFRAMAPETIVKSPENLNPKVTSGPFMMGKSIPGDSYTVVPNPEYYRTREGLPYLDKIVFSIVDSFALGLQKLQTGSVDATGLIQDIPNYEVMKHLKNYMLVYPAAQSIFEALYFNFHNPILANHQEVRQAMAIAVDQQSIITQAMHGLGTQLCTDHSSAFHPGYDPDAPCPVFSLTVANKILNDNGWVKGADGVRAKGGERLEFEYSTAANQPWRPTIQAIIQHDFAQIGIKLDIQNYPQSLFFNSFLPAGKASPATGAVAGRYDIAEFNDYLYYDPDDSSLFACNQFPPVGINLDFYCNPSLDKLFEQEQATADPGVRQEIFRQIHQIYLTQFPFIVLYDLTQFALVHKGTHNYLPGPFVDAYNIAEWWCDNGKC